MKIPEVQKSRKRQRSESEDIIQEIDVKRENKRRRTNSGQLNLYSAIGNAWSTVKDWFFGRKISNSCETDSSSSTMSKRSDLNQGNDDIRIIHDTRRQTSKEVKTVEDDDDDVEFVGEIASPQAQFNPPGHSTIIASTLKRTQPLFITTQEKLHKDRSDRRRPGFLVSQIKQKNITARSQFESSPGLWKSKPFLDIPKPTFRRTFKKTTTPKVGSAKISMEQKMDFEKYKAILRGEGPYLYTVRSPTMTSPQRTPIFARKKGVYSPAAIERSYLKNTDGSKSRLGQMLDRYQEKKQTELINLAEEDPIVSRPKCYAEDREDKDIIEILDVVSPPRSPSSRKTPPSKNSLCNELQTKEVYQDNFLEELQAKYDIRKKDREVLIREEEVKAKYSREYAERLTKSVEERMKKHLAITEIEIPEVEDDSDEEEEDEEAVAELPEITPEMQSEINRCLSSPASVTLVEAHSIPITRKDLDTLRGLNWLNDEIINFYLAMIVARSKENDNWPNVYTMNTFFLKKIQQQGYSMVRRWTRKVDIFSYDIIFVPVHLDVHWCLAVINLKKKGVYFYDSMGSDKTDILKTLLNYLEDEHKDKKKSPFDTSGFEIENVKDIPRQMNGSDCGMFTLKYSEYLSRNASITFTQEDMPYFRSRLVYEIVTNKIIHP